MGFIYSILIWEIFVYSKKSYGEKELIKVGKEYARDNNGVVVVAVKKPETKASEPWTVVHKLRRSRDTKGSQAKEKLRHEGTTSEGGNPRISHIVINGVLMVIEMKTIQLTHVPM